MLEYKTIYSVAAAPLPWMLMAAPLLFVAIGVILTLLGDRLGGSTIGFNKKGWGFIMIGGGVLFLFIWSWGLYEDYSSLRNAYKKGEFAIVEGAVEDFGSRPDYGAASEGFNVNGIKFEYSEYELTGAYNQASWRKDGPIQDGTRVRISYVSFNNKNRIIKLEVAR